jgi:DNA-binding response OmpR family regulator
MIETRTVTDMPTDLQNGRPPILLMAEDEPMISDLIAMTLQDAGFEVVCVDSGVEAIAELNRTPNRFAGLVTDIRMGGGKDGWAVARRARELMPEVAVVYVSGDSEGQWTTHGVPQSVMVPKPFSPSQIVTAISAMLKQRGP